MAEANDGIGSLYRMTEQTVLELENVSLFRGRKCILDKICWLVSNGQNTALLGPNGCGKSTLLKLITRNLYPSVVDGQAGSVRIFGQTEWNVWDLRSRLGMVSSELDNHFLIGRSGRLTALQAVLTGFFASELEPDDELVTSSMRSKAKDALRVMEIDSLQERLMGHLSTGERRRVMLARALIHEPETLILDEPTSGLDIRAQDQLLQRLEFLANSGTTLIIVTHHFEEVLPCVQRTVLMQSGQIVFDGPTSDAMQGTRLASIFQSDLFVEQNAKGRWHVRLLD
jgi:iron complex transport system ATP-binding protein